MSCPARQGSPFEVTSDLGSGMNYSKQDLKRLLADLIAGKVDRLVITHKDRLLRFGTELVFAICEAKRAEVVTEFSARLYGSRSRKNRRILAGMMVVAEVSRGCWPTRSR